MTRMQRVQWMQRVISVSTRLILVGDDALAFDETADGTAKSKRQILQLALATLVADRAIQRMVDEQEFHRIALRRQRALRLREDLHAIGNRGCARRLRLRHRPATHLDLDHAHAAIGGDGQFFVVTEARNRHADAIGGLNDHRALRRKHLGAIDLDRDMIGRCSRRHWLRAHARAPVEAGIRQSWDVRLCSTDSRFPIPHSRFATAVSKVMPLPPAANPPSTCHSR
jgi:hypothetical protein